MADITKCMNINCHLKNKCWRYLAPSDKYRQSYALFELKDGKCNDFWEYKRKRQKIER